MHKKFEIDSCYVNVKSLDGEGNAQIAVETGIKSLSARRQRDIPEKIASK